MISFKMKFLLYLFYLQVTFSCFFVDGEKIRSHKRKGILETRRNDWNTMETLHMPEWYQIKPKDHKTEPESGTTLPDPRFTPDYRIAEPAFTAHPHRYSYNYFEFHRPIRISPHYKQTYRWSRYYLKWFGGENDEIPRNLGCYCTTVYKRLVLLAGCAVITRRHVLTTASSTELVLNKLKAQKLKEIHQILGVWYDTNLDKFNSSMYGGPARIHFHPRYGRPHTVNISHPIPCHYDLAVWTMLHNVHMSACICLRGASHKWEFDSTTPRMPDIAHIVGFQFLKAFGKLPTPWHKYAVRSRGYIVPCPKTEWGWFHCLQGNWAKFGLESGAAWHRALQNRYWLYDGLIGMAAFSMNLRSEELTHYFTIINRNSVLDFLYDSYVGMLPYEFLDDRFHDTKWGVPQPKVHIPRLHSHGHEMYTKELPFW